ncbi:nuclear transport factor 2 family protein [Nocardiopsis alkaliphila]|uniref:nuclear transport factor 2 family protein n=1 Tax=Nocardiopsis alkaliphila TaxID=225762 RepID=UPI00034D1DA1|nr:nuclear transport factor 2 family protein [Nocardiopsis alkaliphila]
MGVLDELLALEHRGWRSLCEGSGDAFYGSLMTERAVMVLAGGMVLDRNAVVASLADAPTWDEYEISEERVLEPAPGSVVIIYTGRAWRAEEPPFVARMSSVYARDEHGWRLCLYQQTPVG